MSGKPTVLDIVVDDIRPAFPDEKGRTFRKGEV
jgi:hypothetical protein